MIYLYVLVASTAIIMAPTGSVASSKAYVLDTFFSVLGFVAFFGYVHDRTILNRSAWIVLVALYFLWEAGSYLFMKHSWFINLFILVAMLPKYWSVALYALITMEPNQETRLSNDHKRDYFVSKFKAVFVASALLAVFANIIVFGMFSASLFLRR